MLRFLRKYVFTEDGFLGGCVIAFFGVVLAAAAGWIMNLVAVAHTIDLPITGLFLLRCAGVVLPPLGAVLGWV